MEGQRGFDSDGVGHSALDNRLIFYLILCSTPQAQAPNVGPVPRSEWPVPKEWILWVRSQSMRYCTILWQGGSPNDYFMTFITLFYPNGDILKF